VLRLLLGQAAGLGAAGIAIGVGLALILTPALASQLFGVGNTDVATYLTVAMVLMATAIAAAAAPARRAMRTDPASSLRST
jgi:ABC-type antimicrobial peptide transport system permease subunit